MSPSNAVEIPLSHAARALGLRCTRTLRNLAAEGLIRIRKVDGRWVVRRSEVGRAKVLTLGRAARLAGCSKATVRRRVAQGVIQPFQPRRSIEPAAHSPFPRFSLADVQALRRTVQRRVRRRRTAPPRRTATAAPRQDAPALRVVRDHAGQLWLLAGPRRFRLVEERPSSPGGRSPAPGTRSSPPHGDARQH
jgi:hypothetical protein